LTRTATTEVAQKVIVSQAEMMRYHDRERIQGYCQSCEKFGVFWSCPPFEEDPMSQLPEWTHAVLVTQKTRVTAGASKDELISQFLTAREILGETMKRWEIDGVTAVIAGHCSGCTDCTRPRGLPCTAPERMRYSLEALGFDVSGLAEGLAGQTMHWPASGVPDYLITVGALLCPRQELAAQLMKAE
jgi:predicted metal-binding protein